jgi:hypothetical protein
MRRGLFPILVLLAAGLLAAPPRAQAQYGGRIEDAIPGGQHYDNGQEPYVPETETQGKKREDTSCPRIASLADADRSTVFDGKGRDVTDIVYQAHLTHPTVECKHRKDRQLNVTVAAEIGVVPGLAAESGEIEVPYFIAIIDPEQLVVTKEQGTARVSIEAGSRTASVKIEKDAIKLVLEKDTAGADLEVVVGLQLDKDQLAYNRMSH